MSKELETLEKIEDFLVNIYDDFGIRHEQCLDTRKYIRHSFNINIIETALKDYEELTSKPVILYGRTHGHTKALIDTICKNYKEVKITNLEDEKKLKALEITSKYDLKKSDITRFETYEDFIKEMYLGIDEKIYGECPKKEEYDLLKEVLL